MGKLVDKLNGVGQSSGGGMGFFGRSRPAARAPRALAIAVALAATDRAHAESVVKSGADIIVITGWTPGADVAAVKGSAEGSDAIWGVEVADSVTSGDAIQSARDSGAAFAVFSPKATARELLSDVEKFDVVVTVDPPTDDLGLVLMRSENLLPAQVALLRTNFSNADLATLTVKDFARLRLMFEGIRFPVLATLREAPEEANVRTLARVGCDAVVLSAAGTDAARLAKQVLALRESLEKIPVRPDDRAGVAIGGLMEAGSAAQTEQPSRRGPTPEPEPEPEHE